LEGREKMYICPKCKGSLGWIGDHEPEEEIYYSQWQCAPCHIEIFFYDEGEKATEYFGA
jgi:hypothetical protein